MERPRNAFDEALVSDRLRSHAIKGSLHRLIFQGMQVYPADTINVDPTHPLLPVSKRCANSGFYRSCQDRQCAALICKDRKTVVWGKRVSVRVNLGGRRNI